MPLTEPVLYTVRVQPHFLHIRRAVRHGVVSADLFRGEWVGGAPVLKNSIVRI